MKTITNLTLPELQALLSGLRVLQSNGYPMEFECEELLSNNEIDDLCERINCGDNREVEVTVNEYDYTVCPQCKSSDINGEKFESDSNTAHQPCSCNNCLATWDDLYILTGYEITSNGSYAGGAE